MKKLLIVLSLSLMFFLPSCGGSGGCGVTVCCFTAPPFRPFIVIYPDGLVVRGGTGVNGTITVARRGFNCFSLAVLVGNNFGLSLTASPSSVYLPGPPASAVITGQSFDATYGMPLVEYFDNYGYLIGSVNANSVSGDGTWLQATMPDLSSVYSGNYSIQVTNMRYDGYYLDIVGSASVNAWGRDRPDSDGDGWYDDQDCAPYDPTLNYNCNPPCGNQGNFAMECNAY